MGNQRDAERLARRALHTVVSRGVSAFATSPLALRSAPARRPGPACRGSPLHAFRAHRLLARGQCLPRIQYCSPRVGGKELCPLRITRGSGDAVTGSRRGAPPRSSRAASCQGQTGREGEGTGLSLVPDCASAEVLVVKRPARSWVQLTPERAVPDPHASRAPPGRAASCRCF